MRVRVWVNGAKGRMGSWVVRSVEQAADLDLAGVSDRDDDLGAQLRAHTPQVCVDFTTPQYAYANAQTILDCGVRAVIGTTGFRAEEIVKLQQDALRKGIGGVIAPNFALGAVLMMRFAMEAARHLPRVEIVETHHEAKAEAPSGTAVRTAELIGEARKETPLQSEAEPPCRELAPGALGARSYPVPIHSLRLPGHVAHQEVIFGGKGESLRIRHDTIDRSCFMPGVLHAIRAVVHETHLHYGLEHLL